MLFWQPWDHTAGKPRPGSAVQSLPHRWPTAGLTPHLQNSRASQDLKLQCQEGSAEQASRKHLTQFPLIKTQVHKHQSWRDRPPPRSLTALPTLAAPEGLLLPTPWSSQALERQPDPRPSPDPRTQVSCLGLRASVCPAGAWAPPRRAGAEEGRGWGVPPSLKKPISLGSSGAPAGVPDIAQRCSWPEP